MASTSGPVVYAANPWFGIEIEIFVKVRDSVKKTIKERIMKKKKVSKWFEKWQWDLTNEAGNQDKKHKQRKYVGQAITGILDQVFGDKHGWTCMPDLSLKETHLSVPPKPNQWWGIEIISPPMSAQSDWQAAIHQVFNSITDTFNLWTNDNCACHVHVSVGPQKKAVYTLAQLMQVAKGAFFFEAAFFELLPRERRETKYARANWRTFATEEFFAVGQNGWQPVWDRIAGAARTGKATDFATAMSVPENDPQASIRYRSTSFNPFAKLHTVELRRQAGVASAETAIYRILLAVTLNVASLEYNFDAASQALGKRHVTTPELIAILNNTLTTRLPAACQEEDFRDWLEECYSNYANDDLTRRFYEAEINEREKNYRNHGQPTLPSTGRPGSAGSNGSGTTVATNTTATHTLPMRPVASSSTSTARPAGNVNYGRTYNENDVRYTPTTANPSGSANGGYTRRLI